MGAIFGGITFVIYTRMKNDGAEDANMMLFLSIFIFIGIISMIYLKAVGEKQGIQQFNLERPMVFATNMHRDQMFLSYYLRGFVNGEEKDFEITRQLYNRLLNQGIKNYPNCRVEYDPAYRAIVDVYL